MKIRKYLCIFGSATALGFCTVLSACNTYPYIPKIKFEASIDSDKTIGFSHHTTDFFPHVDYEINISGTINEGDIIEPVIYQQTCEGKICNNLSIDDDFWKININPDTKKIIVRVEKTPFSENTPWSTHFTLVLNVIRNLQTIYKLLINDLYFVNATPTTEDVFLTHEDGENHIILDGWKDDAVSQEKIRNSDLFLLPKNIDFISANAFYDTNSEESKIPDNLVALELDSTLGNPALECNLTKIGANAFSKAPFKRILMGAKLTEIENQAFSQNIDLTSLDLSYFEEIPEWSGINIFEGIISAEPSKCTIYVRKGEATTPSKWINFFKNKEGEDHSFVHWNYVII